jgi:hypothetical protein
MILVERFMLHGSKVAQIQAQRRGPSRSGISMMLVEGYALRHCNYATRKEEPRPA